ncbi:cytochrome C biogenesis protein [Candidatus Woesearchaeota archaeon]|nr:cytochrome C biogenesis protein [Candidatus Woesearchaeota archaeon]
MAEVTVVIAFVAGLISFLSPCVLPLIPGFLAYVSGSSQGKHLRLRLFLNSLAFVLGFSVVFAALGVLLNTVLEKVSYDVQTWLARIAGAIIIIFGLYLLGLIKIGWLSRSHQFRVKRFNVSYVTSFVFGAAFAVGWTPCVSAVLGTVFALAATMPGLGFTLLMSYAFGLGIPFLIVGLFTEPALRLINRSQTVLKYFNLIVGILMLLLGILVFTSRLAIVANWFLPARLLIP